MGVDADDGRLEVLARAIEDSPHNLMSARGLAELRDRHLPECVAFAGMLPAGPAKLADVGSGGGLPGLVIALLRPDLEVTLIESTHKKAVFLEEAAEALGVDAVVVRARAEEVGPPHRHGYELVTARAVAPLERLIPWALHLLTPHGRLYAIKGDRWAEELDDARAVLQSGGASVAATPHDLRPEHPLAPRVVIIAADGMGSGSEGA